MSDYSQTSFVGGMNLLLDDTRLQPNQYRVGFNLRNRYDALEAIKNSVKDESGTIVGLKQGLLTFGEYVIVFAAGGAFYRKYDQTGWTRITQFSMSPTAPRYWTVAVPLAVTNYGRLAVAINGNTLAGVNNIASVAAANQGNFPGLLVQDNINQPQFIFIDASNNVQCRTTQTYAQWEADYITVPNKLSVDKREYVPVGNLMVWVDGVLYIVAQNKTEIYRSVSGRPLDFVVNVDIYGAKGGNASTTSYTVGIGNITALKQTNDGSLFVSASGSNFSVSKDREFNPLTLFGEYPFIRKFLFEATCLSDRTIIDSLGDTRFIDLTGVRSFNAIQQLQIEGQNSPFTATVASAFKDIIQDTAAAISYDNYELYAVTTAYGNVILVFDTINNCWSSLDTTQTAGSKIKQFAKIELGVLRLFAITEDDQLYTLYSADSYATATMVSPSFVSKEPDYKPVERTTNTREVKMASVNCVMSNITTTNSLTLTPIINNRISAVQQTLSKDLVYAAPVVSYAATLKIPHIDSMLLNVLFSTPNCEHGWKTSFILSWVGGASLARYSMFATDSSHDNSLRSQQLVK